MTQHNLTQILKVIRDLVMRNRPCYRDYLGTETVTKTIQIGSGTWEDGESECGFGTPVADSSFKGFVLGETYTVTLDGVSADYVAREIPIISEEIGVVIGTVTALDEENNTYDGWMVGYNPTNNICFGMTLDMSFAGKTISVSQTKTETVKRYKTKLLPEHLLPAWLRKNVVASKAEVQSAAAKATAAANTAADAQTTADNARDMIERFQIGNASDQTEAIVNFSFDGLSDGRTQISYNEWTFYKISEFAPDSSQVMSFAGTAKTGYNRSTITVGTNCCEYGFFTVVNKPGECSVRWQVSGGTSVTKNFIAQEAGLYARLADGNDHQTAGMGVFRLKRPSLWLQGGEAFLQYGKEIILMSSTSGSEKNFRITVDDTGTLTATEVTSS